MACAVDNSDKKIAEILQANNTIKKSISAIIQEYLDLQNRFFDKVGSVIQNLETVQSVANIFLTDEQKTFLKEFKPIEGVQLAICGYNSAGKTTFVHELLACGNFLPTGIGAVSARIIKFSYAPANEACLIKYQSQLDPNEPEEIVELSSHFVGPKSKANTKLLKETIKKHVARPEIDCMSDEFEKWASHLIEIRIPSRFLQYGIDVYDTPGFLGNDPPILAENLLKLVSSVRPSLVYLYDNPVVSDDSRKCFEQLQLALRHHFRGTAIFFLNTKADVLTIRKDADDDDDDDDDENDNLKKNECEDRLLNSERKQRYNLLLTVNEMNSAILGGKHLPIDQYDCFDIFSSQGSTDSMEIKMKTHAINSIVRFAAEHDLRSTKQIISIVLGTIDDFFDFVLITNRRSPTEWTTMYVHTYQWIDEYFATYQSHIDEIANEAKILLPIKFSQHCEDIEKRAIPHCVTTWWERIYASSLSRDSIVANLDLANHHGLPLTIQRDTVLGTGGFFTIYLAIWGSEQNLVVKELKDPIADQDIACLEAHFHRTVTRLQIPHMVPLEYLYETVKDPRQFVIVLRRYPKSLHSHLMTHMQEISIDKALQISLDISRAIALMHSYELVHRDVKAQNILLDANDQVYLADFGTCQHGTENSTFIGSRPFVPELTTGDHQYSYQGSAFDVFCLGILMYVVAPKDVFHQPRTLAETDVNSLDRNRVPDSYSRLILRCINTEPILRPKANEVVEELERIINTIAYSKPCLVCLDAPRTIRCLPCQHKTMCTTCLAAAQQASEEPQCIICRDIFTSVEEDADPNTFIVARTPTTVIQ
ncbi:unnamed protein product [Rotaria sp. Silwood2]|nr:unnamed protein product [Rotaria sp. Silwood2]